MPVVQIRARVKRKRIILPPVKGIPAVFGRRGFGVVDQVQVLGVCGLARISAQARATSESVVLLPGIVAKPLFSTTLPRSQVLALVSSAILVSEPGWARKRSAQIGAKTATFASLAAVAAVFVDVPPVTQPPQPKPTMARPMAPTAAPHTYALVFSGSFMVYLALPRPRRQEEGFFPKYVRLPQP